MASLASTGCSRCGVITPPRASLRLLPGREGISQIQPRQGLRRHTRRASGVVYAKNDVGGALDSVIDSVRPGFIPRPVAKGALLFFGISFVVSLVQKLLSAALLFGVLAGGGYLWFKAQTAGGNK